MVKKINKGFPFGVFAMAALLFLAVSCKKKEDQAAAYGSQTQTVYALTVSQGGSGVFKLRFPTRLISGNQIDLRTDINGRVERLLFKEGSYVRAGQPLYDIDKSRYYAAYQKAVAQVRISEASARKAQLNAQRYANLLKHDAIEKMTADNAQADADVARARLEADRAELKRIKTDLDYATVKAPFSGYISASSVRVGDLVGAGQTVLARMSDKNTVMADVFVSEQAYSLIASGQELQAEKPTFLLELSDGSIYPHNGQLSFVENSLDASTASYRVRLSFVNPKGVLKPGMSASINVEKPMQGKQTEGVILIPQKAMQEKLGERYVFLVNQKNQIKSQVISTGLSMEDLVVVNSGLKPGDRLVVDGIQKVKPGDVVQVEPYK